MEFLYYIINFLILAGIILLLFGKKIIDIFKSRRIKIEQELNDAENENNSINEAVAPKEPQSVGVLSDGDTDNPLEEARELTEKRINQVKAYTELECRDLTLHKMQREQAELIKLFSDAVKEKCNAEEYTDIEKLDDEKTIDRILGMIKLTAGDMAYLKQHEVLYVTLFSANKLPEALIKKVENAALKLIETVNGKISFWVKEDPVLIGGVRLRIGDTMYDGTALEQIYLFSKAIEKMQVTEFDTTDTLLERFSGQIEKTEHIVSVYQLGRVISVSDGICWMDGLADIMYGEVVEFECGARGMVLDIQKDRIGCVIYSSYEHIESYSRVRRVGRIASVPVGEGLLGRVVDSIGNPIDAKGHLPHSERRAIEFAAPGILDRAAVNRPLHTGIKAIDSMVPIGKGQRELIVGDRQTGKTSIVVDTIVNQKGKDVICIYVGIGQKETTVSDIREKLYLHGALDYTVIVSATASDSAALQYMAPFAATAMGEYFMYSGKDVLIVYDDLSKHAVAYRELSLLLQRPSGREAYPGDIFYLHSRLLERSAQLSDELSGGSMTALPIIETQAGDISSYIPTNVISITDGQIFLESELFHEGQRPAINVGLSVSRVGGAAQTKLMKQVSASLRTQLAQYRELAEFTQFGADMDDETKKTLNAGEHLTEALKQSRFKILEDWQQALLLYSVSHGFTNEIPINLMHRFERMLYSYFLENKADLVETLKTGNKLSPDTAQKLDDAISEFAARF
ncbi:MAG: F0F1 ATP synthase subunit alpha [Clostridiales bacterium]|nr:F0F1 ATP synthase subunit alpha [Candidatus Equinaster intestinalis]